MDLKKLHSSFYKDNPYLIQALDFDSEKQVWILKSENGQDKVRGHGIVKIQFKDLTFAIPVRSNIKHKECFILEVNLSRDTKGMGLDYSKALLIKDAAHVSNDDFVLRSKQAGKKLIGKKTHIEKKFNQYVEKYVKAVKCNDKNIRNSSEYRFTTLVNYHSELGLE